VADLERLTDLELVPVVEVRAWAFSERVTPQGPSRSHREMWHRYWLDCLADAGITGLQPIEPGSMHVAASTFADPGKLRQVLQRLLEPEALTDPEAASSLDGGVALVSDGRILTVPNCCSDLDDWTEWQPVANDDANWRILWIGHPWLSIRAEGSDLVLSKPHESDAPEPRWVFERELVAPAVEAAVAELESFANYLATALLDSAGNGPHANRIARTLAGLPARDGTTPET
jgi:hypothetical protein